MRVAALAWALLMPIAARAESTLQTLASELVTTLAAAHKAPTESAGKPPALAPWIACGTVRGGEAARSAELSRRACRVIAARLPGAQLIEDAQSMQSAWKRAGTASRLAFVELELAHGELRASLDVHERSTNVWERMKGKKPAPIAHAAASAPIDAEVRGFLPPLSLEEAKLRSYRLGGHAVLAMACGAFGTEPGNRLALLTERELLVGRLHGKAFAPERRVPLTSLGSRSPVPSRPPLANLVATGDWQRPLAVGSSERPALVLDRALTPARALGGVPFLSGKNLLCTRIDPALGAYVGRPSDCAATPPPITARRETFDAIATSELIDRGGNALAAFALREPSGKLALEIGAQRGAVDAVGAQLALADLDQDGALEIAYALDSSGDDALVIASFDGKGLRLRKRWASKAQVTAITTCPAEDQGLLATVAAVGDEVWVVR